MRSIDTASALPRFTHRAYNGWITDLATEPEADAVWPSVRIDEHILADFHQTFDLMRRFGMNELVLWGIYVADDWPVDLQSAVSEGRARLMNRLIAEAHDHGIRVICGLGVYSWGFVEIIRQNPKLNGGNPKAMCASEPLAQEWMRRVVDYIFERFPIDGVSMQSADQGRCACARCARQSDAEYHAAILAQTAEYVRSIRPDALVGMSNWGVSFADPRDLDIYAGLSRSLDYMIDQNNSACAGGPEYRSRFIQALACPFGTTGGMVVEPPQHWQRDRWFLPTCRNVHDHLAQLSAEGGRACEFFYHQLVNPGAEVTFHIAARALAQPGASLEKQMLEVMEELYRPRSIAARDGLAAFFLDAESAYTRYLAPDAGGTLSLEPLVSDRAGPPVYLTERLNEEQRRAYGREIAALAERFERLRPDLGAPERADRIARCLKNVVTDVEAHA